MRISCPYCSAAYDVPETLIRDRRTVRCAQCLREWSVGPVPGDSAASPPKPRTATSTPKERHGFEVREGAPNATVTLLTERAPALGASSEAVPLSPPAYAPDSALFHHAPNERLLEETGPEKPGAAVWAAWTASVAVLIFLGWAAYAWRSDVMDAWPPSQRLYATLGLRSAPE